MKDIQVLFNQMHDALKEQKEIRKEYKDALTHEQEYQKITEEMKTLREKKKEIESFVQQSMGERYAKLDDLKHEAEELKTMISDIAVTTYLQGGNIEVVDAFDNVYEPQFSIKFKKTDAHASFNNETPTPNTESASESIEDNTN